LCCCAENLRMALSGRLIHIRLLPLAVTLPLPVNKQPPNRVGLRAPRARAPREWRTQRAHKVSGGGSEDCCETRDRGDPFSALRLSCARSNNTLLDAQESRGAVLANGDRDNDEDVRREVDRVEYSHARQGGQPEAPRTINHSTPKRYFTCTSHSKPITTRRATQHQPTRVGR
jgi:hypothetical protein